jgi:hypothetical protein
MHNGIAASLVRDPDDTAKEVLPLPPYSTCITNNRHYGREQEIQITIFVL